MPTRYFVRRLGSEPFYVFRILPNVSVQVYDVAGHSWRPEPLEPFYRWALIDGEIGVDEIDEAAAGRIIDRFHRRGPRDDPALHRLDGPDAEAPRYRSVFDKGADEPQFRPAGDFFTVDGVLESLPVQGVSRRKQRAAIARVHRIASLRPFLEGLAPQLRTRGLLVDSEE
jgi:hypothetical protein